MGELLIHIKVLKNSPILFTWLNKETYNVEGCLVTCHCQKLGLTETSCQSVELADILDPRDQIFLSQLGQALKRATILSTPERAETGSVLIPVRKIRSGESPSGGNTEDTTQNQICSKGNDKIKFTTGTDRRERCSFQPNRALFIRLADDIIGTELGDSQNENNREGILAGDVNVELDKTIASLSNEKDSIATERVSKQGAIDEGALTEIEIFPSVNTVTENGNMGPEDFEKEEETEKRIKEELNDQSDKSDESDLEEEKSFGTCVDSRCEEEKELLSGDTCKTTASNLQSHQGNHTQSNGNLQETGETETSDSRNAVYPLVEGQIKDIIIHNSITDPGGGEDKIVDIEIGSSVSNPKYVEKESRDSISEIERTLCAALKSLTDQCQTDGQSDTDLQQHSDDANTPSVLCSSAEMDENPNTESPGPNVDSLSKGRMSTAMLRYKKYENEQFLKKLHKLEQQKGVHAAICEVCGALLSDISGLKKHMTAVHSVVERERNFECSTCHMKFLYARNLERHQLSHTDYRSKCRFCTKSFKYDYYRNAHEKLHLPNPPPPRVPKPVLQKKQKKQNKGSYKNDKIFTCDICGKSVRLVSKNQHLQTHREKKYHCTVCDFRVGTRSGLKLHMKKHTKERNIPCRMCGQLFGRYQDRLNHERKHTGEKPFICHICDKRWRDRSTYHSHMKKNHPGMPLMYLRPLVQVPDGTVKSTESAQGSEEA